MAAVPTVPTGHVPVGEPCITTMADAVEGFTAGVTGTAGGGAG
jgi:hypothetical protein